MPAKVVGHVKCACKEWYALLSTQDFVRIHSSRSLVSSNQRILLIGDLSCSVLPVNFQSGVNEPSTIISFPFNAQFNDVSILSNLDGSLCVWLNHTTELLLWNPITNAYKNLSTADGHGFFEDIADAIGLFIDAYDDYKVLHMKRAGGVLSVYVYSRREDSWRNIPFITRPEYISRNFYWSPGTSCGNTLYFTVCDCWVGGKNVVICFDVKSGQFKEISFPRGPSKGIFRGTLVSVKNHLHMFLTTGLAEMSTDLWMLQGEHWIKVFSCPPIPPYHCHYGAL